MGKNAFEAIVEIVLEKADVDNEVRDRILTWAWGKQNPSLEERISGLEKEVFATPPERYEPLWENEYRAESDEETTQ